MTSRKGKPWTPDECAECARLLDAGVPQRDIMKRLDRSWNAIDRMKWMLSRDVKTPGAAFTESIRAHHPERIGG